MGGIGNTRLRLSSRESLPNWTVSKSEICNIDWNTPTVTNYLTLFLQNLFLWSYLVSNVIHMRSISGEEDLFHHINAEGFLETKPLHYVMPSDLRPCIVCFSSPSLRHMCVTLVCVCVYHAGRRWHNWCTLCAVYKASLFMSLVIVIDIMWALSPTVCATCIVVWLRMIDMKLHWWEGSDVRNQWGQRRQGWFFLTQTITVHCFDFFPHIRVTGLMFAFGFFCVLSVQNSNKAFYKSKIQTKLAWCFFKFWNRNDDDALPLMV